ncbi:MAG: carboxypeptidase-like regulatory domain-containing protein [Bacteroidales bacterium]
MNKFIYTTVLFILSISVNYSQTVENEKYVQVSGIITDKSDRPVPGVAVVSRKLKKGTLSERTGIYSITSIPGDTIFFRALGFKRYHTIIPGTFEEKHCEVDIALEIDTIQIKEVNIMPWKNYSDFIKDITKARPVDPIIDNMNDNIASIYVAIANQGDYKVSPEAGYRYAMEQNFGAMATRGQYPINNLLNPFAWAKFINGIKNGLFKSQKFNKPVKPKVRKKIKKADKNN